MLRSCIDHIVITAPSLAEGAAYVESALGVAPQPGGEHSRMGTHNLLLKLGDEVYLEVIAINPKALPPDRPRWFGLDGIAGQPARLATWVARSGNIHDACAASPIPLGHIEAMTRGPLQWKISIPADGGLVMQGIAPSLIQWETDPHPASGLHDAGCSLIRVEAFHSDAQTADDLLEKIGFEGPLDVLPAGPGTPAHLIAHIQTPSGPRRLSGLAAA
ncbi:VOC family protein [Pollutimonas sp. H1-120]|uniref:VOC family protein n=1 Tax=Pollutimonas sp. H1-120 TaxID=3148824 RepID=UPI003B51EE74